MKQAQKIRSKLRKTSLIPGILDPDPATMSGRVNEFDPCQPYCPLAPNVAWPGVVAAQ